MHIIKILSKIQNSLQIFKKISMDLNSGGPTVSCFQNKKIEIFPLNKYIHGLETEN